VHDELVGKEWEKTYMAHSSKNNFIFDTLASYNRKTGGWTLNKLGDDEVYLNEPVIIPAADRDYLLTIVNRDTQSFAEIFDSKTLERTCQIQLPESVPAGFHGKWDNQL
jgi:carotenoid cleavage dioxygenase-like enzyme